ncbi:hypothetical protein MMC31_002894 [Peltigera leucophlebia]|nr:hypothetical protein [Peltigera leucophlebia]
MPGAAALVNESVPSGESIHLYYTTENLNLALVLEAADESRGTISFSPNSTDHKGIIVNPSHISAAEYIGINIVVGITQPALKAGESDYTNYDVSIVSPVYQPIATTETPHTSISISSSGDNAWVYYLEGPDADSLRLLEFDLSAEVPVSQLGTTKVQQGSSLAAYWRPDQKKRFIIYQDASTSELYEYSIDDENSLHIKNSDDARVGTPLAVTYVNNQVYLYYIDNLFQPRKVVKVNDEWGSTSGFDNAGEVDDSSQLAVATSNQVNHLFFLEKGATTQGFAHVRDPIGS